MGKAALVTGASGGIGAQIAIELAKNGYDIGLHYRSNIDKANELKNEIESLGQRVILLQADLTNSDECTKIANECIEQFDGIYALINNAGITKDTLCMRMKDEEFDIVLDANLNSCFYMSRACMPYMIKKKTGKIINISSVIGIMGNAGQANYAASKAGIIGFSKSIAKEVATKKICVNVIAPGYIITPMTDVLNDRVKDAILSKIPLKRFGEAKDIAYLVNFLCSEKADYITGQVISVDGGMAI